jgi:WD40 repeat protein
LLSTLGGLLHEGDDVKGDDEISSTAPAAPSPNTATSPDSSRSITAAVSALTSPAFNQPPRNSERYELLGEHGRGGLGRVSRARDRELERDVAVKELLARNYVSEVRFFREALITARLEHPGIVPVHEAGRRPDGTPFYAMKLVAGRPLRDLIGERHTTDERLKLLHHVIAVAEAIAYAHDRHIIHRDLKPANVIVGDFGETIVIDWGLAKDLSTSEDPMTPSSGSHPAAHAELTTAGTVLGTPAYMAPEQERGAVVDQRADVFAIGAMLWELCALSKVPPLEMKPRHRLLRRAKIDPDLITILDKCLARDPAHRYPDAGALAGDLKAFKTGVRITARQYSLPAMLLHWTRRHRALATASIMLLAIAALVAVLYVRDVTMERNLADQARAEAVRERGMAALERDRAQLSEATVWLEKDASHAVDLLRASRAWSPQRALLLSEAQDRAATYVLHADGRIFDMQVDDTTHEVAIVTKNGTLDDLDLEHGTLRVVDHDLNGPLVRHRGQWCYATQPGDQPKASLSAGCGTTTPLGNLLKTLTSKLFSIAGDLYVLDDGELSRFEAARLTLQHRHIKGFSASDTLSVLCTDTGALTIKRSGQRALTSTCITNSSNAPLAVHGEHFAALATPNELITDRGPITLPSAIKSQFALAMGDRGQIGIVDFAGEAWVIPADSKQAERPTLRSAHPTAVSIVGDLAAFGYADGAVVVFDLHTHQSRTFIGHTDIVTSVELAEPRIVSVANSEIRIWSLRAPPLQPAATLPCQPFHIVPTRTANEYALDCNDGQVSRWTDGEQVVHAVHKHREISFGIALWHDQICTGGWDERVLCTANHGATEELLHASERVRWLVSCEDRGLFVAIADGNVWQTDGSPRLLYKHAAQAYRLAVDASCRRLASVGYDGSLIVYDLVNGRIIAQAAHAHDGQIISVQFAADDLITSGVDAKIKRWHLSNSLELATTVSAPGPIGTFAALDNGWVAAVNDQTIALHSNQDSATIEISLTHPIKDITTSSDQRYIAIAAIDEVVVFDQYRHAIATAQRPSGDINCLQFLSASKLAACDTSAVLTLDIDRLNFVPLF